MRKGGGKPEWWDEAVYGFWPPPFTPTPKGMEDLKNYPPLVPPVGLNNPVSSNPLLRKPNVPLASDVPMPPQKWMV